MALRRLRAYSVRLEPAERNMPLDRGAEALALQAPRAQPQKKAAQSQGRRAAHEPHDSVLAIAAADGNDAAQGQHQHDDARYGEEPADPSVWRRGWTARRGRTTPHRRRNAACGAS